MAFKFLLRHSNSFLAATFESLLEDTSFLMIPELTSTDWCSPASIEAGFASHRPKVVVNFLPDDADLINSVYMEEQAALVEVCVRKKIPLIQLSSYRVFGEVWIDRGWRETDEPNPEDAFGKKLLQLERCVARLPKHIILRVGWILEGRNGLLEQFVPPLLNGEKLVVSDHRYGSPLSQKYIARALLAMIQQIVFGADNWKAFHLHSGDRCSEAEFADQVVRLLKNEFKLGAAVPTVATIDDERFLVAGCGHLLGRRCTANFGIQLPTWRPAFTRSIKAWMEETVLR